MGSRCLLSSASWAAGACHAWLHRAAQRVALIAWLPCRRAAELRRLPAHAAPAVPGAARAGARRSARQPLGLPLLRGGQPGATLIPDPKLLRECQPGSALIPVPYLLRVGQPGARAAREQVHSTQSVAVLNAPDTTGRAGHTEEVCHSTCGDP